jgi:hypothetical protein
VATAAILGECSCPHKAPLLLHLNIGEQPRCVSVAREIQILFGGRLADLSFSSMFD